MDKNNFFQARGNADLPSEIYRRAHTVDAMCFSMEPPPQSFVQYLTAAKVDALRTSGNSALAINMTSHFDELKFEDNLFDAVKKRVSTWDNIVAAHPDVFSKITTISGLDAAKVAGLVGFIYCFQMSSPFGWDLGKLERFVQLGVRQIQLVDGNRNYIADSCWERTDAGLSRFGFEVVDAFADLGVILDLSHVGEKSTLDAIAASNKPAIFSHAGC